MICDLHVHTHFSPDCSMEPDRLVEVALRRGLDAVAITDHDTTAGVRDVQRAARHTPLLVIPGIEIRTRVGEVIGLFVEDDITPGLEVEETVDAIAARGGIVVVPHPFDRLRRSALGAAALSQIAARVDAVETFNSRSLIPLDDRDATRWAALHRRPGIAGSDAHLYREIGRGRTRLHPFQDAQSLVDVLGTAQILGRRSSPFVHVATAIRKRVRAGGIE